MRVHLEVSGGVGYFPGLAAPRTIDADTLTADAQRSLRELIDAAQFFSLPTRIAPRRGAADYKTYQITIEDGDRRHTVAVPEPAPSAPLEQLVRAVCALVGR